MSPLLITFIGVLVGACVLGLAVSLRSWLIPGRTARDRIAQMTSNSGASLSLFGDIPSTSQVSMTLSRIATPATEDERSALRNRLVQGGFRSRANLERYLLLRTICALIPPLFTLLLAPDLPLPGFLVMVLGSTALGYYLPAVVLDWRIRSRQALIMRPFPDALDLLVCCVEAGLGIDAAFRRVAEEMEPAAPELAHELQLVNHEVAAGVPRADALRHLDRRTGLSEMASLVSVLVQADRFGTSIAKALRVHATLVRRKRMLFAEERAARISPKLTVVMILFILPSLIVVLVGPAIININQHLWPTLSSADQ